MTDRDILTTAGQIADFLDVTTETVHVWRRKKGLPARKIGNRLVATKRSLLIWVEQYKEAK